MGNFTQGKHAFGYCDKTGFRYRLNDLVPQFEKGRPNGFLVGKDMVDIDHEQLRLDEVIADDSQSLENPRIDQSQIESRALSAFDPVGGGVTVFGSRTVGLDIHAAVGRASVT